jgi:centrosomal protein CEP290
VELAVHQQVLDRLRVANENERKAKRKVDQMTSRVAEMEVSLETTKRAENETLAALTRVKTERDTMEKKLTGLQKKQATLDAAMAGALAELEPVSILKTKIFELEERVGTLRQQLEVDVPAQNAKMRAECESLRVHAEAVEKENTELRGRFVSPSVAVAQDDAVFRERLGDARRRAAALESAVLSKDAIILELQLELEAARQTGDRLRKRIAEVTAFATISARGKPLDALASSSKQSEDGNESGQRPASANQKFTATPGGRSGAGTKREAELEDLVTALRRVTDRQKAEIERLKKNTQSGTAAALAVPEALALSSAGSAVVARGKEMAGDTTTAAALRAARAELDKLREKLLVTDGQVAELSETRRALLAAQGEMSILRRTITDLEKEKVSLQAMATASGAAEEIARLQNDNAAIREELDAFDASFFEELEDLKSSYADASKKCKAFDAYVKIYPPVAGLPPEFAQYLANA